MHDPGEYIKDDEPTGWSGRLHSSPVGVASDVTALDNAGRIAGNVVCRACGYNLRGTDPQSVCPECGTAIGWSLVGDRLRFADPIWVRRLSTGAGCLIAALLLNLTLGCISRGMVSGVVGHGTSLFTTFLDMLPSAIGAVGYWLVTTPEPVEKFNGPVQVRITARWCCVLPPVINLMLVPMATQDSWLSMITVIGIFVMLGGLIGLVGQFTLLVYARRIALRVPDESLASQTRIVMWGLIGSMGFTLFVGFAMMLASDIAGNAGASDLGGMVGVGGIALLVFAIWSIVLLFMYRNRLQKAATQAEQSWARNARRD